MQNKYTSVTVANVSDVLIYGIPNVWLYFDKISIVMFYSGTNFALNVYLLYETKETLQYVPNVKQLDKKLYIFCWKQK